MIEDALRYPMDRDDWIKTLVIGGVLTFFGFLLLPLFVVYGYIVRTIQESIEGESTPPAFEEWSSLLVSGLQAWIIGIIYLLIPAIVAFVTIGGSIGAIATGGRLGTGAGLAGLMGGIALTAVLSLAFGYIAVAAIVCFAHEERFGAAFDVNRLRTIILSGEYAVAWVVSIVMFIIAGIITGIPLIGFILGPFVTFYTAIVAARLWADGYSDALDLDIQTASESL